MKMQFGAIVVAGSGKIGGQVASRNRGGAYLRTKVTPVNPQSTAQLGARQRLTGRSQAWRGLTQAQRDAWNAAVSAYARTDIFGSLRNPSGFNLYQRINNNLLTVNQAALTTPAQVAAVATVGIVSLTAVVTGGVVTLTLSGTVPAGTSVKVFATAPQSQGVNFVKSEYRLISTLAAAAPAAVVLTTAYATKFGAYVAGQKIFVAIEFVNNLTGQTSTRQQIFAITA
jgi:hypothetical protein